MNPILIENGKKPDELFHASLGFWLPPDTPYGNFQLKWFNIIERLDEANRRILESYHFWEKTIAPGIKLQNEYQRHVLANEQFIFLIRRNCDELISLIWCLQKWELSGKYPKNIEIDSIGKLLKKSSAQKIPPFVDHLENLKCLNEISNAMKHSFINSDYTLIGQNEPCVHALTLKNNQLNADSVFYSVTLKSLIENFNNIYRDSRDWLKQFSERHMPGKSSK